MVLCRLVRPCVISEARMLLSLSIPSTCILTKRRFCLEETTTDCIVTSQEEQLYAYTLSNLVGSLLVPVVIHSCTDYFTAATLHVVCLRLFLCKVAPGIGRGRCSWQPMRSHLYHHMIIESLSHHLLCCCCSVFFLAIQCTGF